MSIFSVFLATVVLLFGLRMVITALQSGLTGKVLVRQGLRAHWQPAPDRTDALKLAIRDGLLGLLLIVLGVMLLF